MSAKRRVVAATSVTVLLMLGCFAGIAAAGGGGSIASAPLVNSGQQEFGNTADGMLPGNPCNEPDPTDFWRIALIAGDRVTIDWETSSDGVNTLEVFPAGTSDFTINNVGSLNSFDIGGNNKAESRFTANRSGIYPLLFESRCADGQSGPFDFTAYIRHLPVLSVGRQKTVKSGKAVVVGAHYSDGKPINGTDLSVQIYGKWGKSVRRLGAATPRSGKAAVKLRIPSGERGKAISIRAVAAAGDFTTVHTPWRTVRVK